MSSRKPMFTHRFFRTLRNIGVAALLAAALLPARGALVDDSVTIGNLAFVNKGLVGAGRIPADLRDKFGETFGSGSSLAVDARSWMRTTDGYQGTFYVLPDRGWNVTGTFDYRARLNKLSIIFQPVDASGATSHQRNVVATLADTILLTDAAREPLTGLDPAARGFHPQAQRQGSLFLPQSRSERCCARPPQSGHRPAEQPGFRGPGIDAGRKVFGGGAPERNPPGRRHIRGDAAICQAALLRHRRSRTPQAHQRARRAAAGVRQRGGQEANRRAERAARPRRDPLPAALP